jgi:hypothetical protein
MAGNFAGKYAMDTMVTTETYSDPRAKEAASDFNDILHVTGTTTCQYSRTLSTYTMYLVYARRALALAQASTIAASEAVLRGSPEGHRFV